MEDDSTSMKSGDLDEKRNYRYHTSILFFYHFAHDFFFRIVPTVAEKTESGGAGKREGGATQEMERKKLRKESSTDVNTTVDQVKHAPNSGPSNTDKKLVSIKFPTILWAVCLLDPKYHGLEKHLEVMILT